MRVHLTRIAGFFFLALAADAASAQRRLDILASPLWPRAAGMADIGAASQFPEGALYNPALAGWSNAIAGSAHFFGSDSMLTTLLAGLSTGVVSVSASLQTMRADLGPDPLLEPLPGRPLIQQHGLTSVSSIAGALRFKGTRWGAAGKFIQLLERAEKEEGFAFDLGAQRPLGRFSVGLAVQNIGPDLDLARESLQLPLRVTLAAEGQGLPVGAFIDFGAVGAIALDRDGEVLPAIGGQILYTPLDGWTFAARAGVRRPAPGSGMRPLTGGFAAALDRLTIDYALEGVRGGDVVQRIGARLR